jgi:hypothetical protein
MIPKPRHNPTDQFAVAMLTDENMHFSAMVGQRNHQLAAVPKCQDNMLTVTIEVLDGVGSANRHAHRLS